MRNCAIHALSMSLVLSLTGAAYADKAPCEVKKEYEAAEMKLAELLGVKQPNGGYTNQTTEELKAKLDEFKKELAEMDRQIAEGAPARAKEAIPAAQKKVRELTELLGGQSKAAGIQSAINDLDEQIMRLEATLTAGGGTKVTNAIELALSAQRDASTEVASIVMGMTINDARSALTDAAMIFPTAEVEEANQQLDEARKVGVRSEIEAAQKKLDAALASARARIQRQVTAFDNAQEKLATLDPQLALRSAMAKLEVAKNKRISKQGELDNVAAGGGANDKETKTKIEAAKKELLSLHLTAQIPAQRAEKENQRASYQGMLDAKPEWEKYQKAQELLPSVSNNRDRLAKLYTVLDNHANDLCKPIQTDIDSLDSRLSKPADDVRQKAQAEARGDAKLRTLWDEGKRDKTYKPYSDRAKAIMDNYVKRVEANRLRRGMDPLAQFDCYDGPKEIIEKVNTLEKTKLKLAVLASADGADVGDLGQDVSHVPDDWVFPLDGDDAGDDKAATGNVWVLQEPKIEHGANATASASSITVKNLPDQPAGTATISFTPPKAVIREGELIELTMTASAGGKGWGLGWFNVGCAGEWKESDNNAASWPEGKRSGPVYNTGKLVFTFSPGTNPYIQVQAGQEAGTSRWASVTWTYKRKDK